jgi:hypothetical protein
MTLKASGQETFADDASGIRARGKIRIKTKARVQIRIKIKNLLRWAREARGAEVAYIS